MNTPDSPPLDPKLMFWRILCYSGVFGTVWLPYKTRSNIGRTRAKVRATKLHRKFSQRTHLIHPIGPQNHFLAQTFGWLTKLGAKRAELVQKFVTRSCIRMFRNERTRSTPQTLNSSFRTFRTILVHLGPFGCLTKLGAKRAELVQKFVTQSRVEIFQNEHTQFTPLDLKHMFQCVLQCLDAFGIVSLLLETWCKTG